MVELVELRSEKPLHMDLDIHCLHHDKEVCTD